MIDARVQAAADAAAASVKQAAYDAAARLVIEFSMDPDAAHQVALPVLILDLALQIAKRER